MVLLLTTGSKQQTSCGRYMMFNIKTGVWWSHLCGCRSCHKEQCRGKYAFRTQKRVTEDCRLNGLNNFFTFTLDHKDWPDPKDAWEQIAKVWNRARLLIERQLFRVDINREKEKFYREMKEIGIEKPHWTKLMTQALYKVRRRFKYTSVLEKHPGSEYPHIHLASDVYLPTTQEKCRFKGERPLSDLLQQAGGGKIVWAKRIEGGAAEYMCKSYRVSQYTTKDLVNIGMIVKRRKRVVWRSRKLVQVEKVKSDCRFVVGYRPFDEFSNQILTDKECRSIMNRNMKSTGTDEHFYEMEQEYEKERQGHDLGGPCTTLFVEGFEGSKPDVETDARREEKRQADQAAKSQKAANQRANQEVTRVGWNGFIALTKHNTALYLLRRMK